MKIPKDTAVAIFAYNRPSHLRRVLIALEDYKICNNVVVFVDGPKNKTDKTCQKEILLILNTKAKSEKIKIIKRKKNLGLASSILKGVDYLFKNYKKVIVLEDDCIPRKGFFEYSIGCLNFYENKKNISAVCAYQIPKLHSKKNKNLRTIFLNNFSSWGWSTWRDRWSEYKKTPSKNNSITSSLILKIDKVVKNKKNIWTRDFMLHNYINKKIYVFPNKSLVKNIGFDGSGVNSKATFDFTTEYSPSKKIFLDKKIAINKNWNKVQEKFIFKNLYQFY